VPVAADEPQGRGKFCAKPFRHLEIAQNGDAYLCCEGWLPRSVGNAWNEPISSIWNGARAQEIRRSILDGSFAFCTACPLLDSVTGSVRYLDEIEEPHERAIVESSAVVIDRIAWLNLAYDRTCNLSCPSCRTDVLVAGGDSYRALRLLQERVLANDLLTQIDWLYVTGSGDPFASRLYRDLLRSIDPGLCPRLQIKLHTNGLLFTPSAWNDLGPAQTLVSEVEVSIDGAGESTYRLNRRGGDWPQLLQRLGFISSLRQTGRIRTLQFSFVVQANNWREMPAFVDVAETFAADRIFFAPLRNWGTFSAEELARRTVHDPRHPEHGAFVLSLEDSRLHRSNVILAGLPTGECR
jgi:MoaA/NifB/PqqE/SkfB family radical SAM enzyme